MVKKYFSIVLLVCIVVGLLPMPAFSAGVLPPPEVRDSSGFTLKTNEIVAVSRKIVLVFDEGVNIDGSSLSGIKLEAVNGDTTYCNPIVDYTEKNRVNVVCYGAVTDPEKGTTVMKGLTADAEYRLTVPAGVKSTDGATLTEDFTFDFKAINGYVLDHMPGESYRTITKDNCIGMDNADETENGILINASGSATYGFYIPYYTRSVKLVYENADGEVRINTGDNEYKFTPDEASGEYILEFGENLHIEPQYYSYGGNEGNDFPRDFAEHRGEKEVVVSSDGGILLKEMVFEKERTPLMGTKNLPDISAETAATYSTVMMDADAPVIVVNGGRRYVDNNDTSVKPLEYKNRLYLPINTLAKALGYYNEDYPEKSYALMRSDTHEVVQLGNKCTVSQGVAEPQPVPYEVFIYDEGKTYASVRYFAELIGDTVGYDDGLVVIDNKYTVESIMQAGSLNDFAKVKFAEFKNTYTAGSTYHVAQNGGNDSNDGSAEAPFKTLKQATWAAKNPGDTVIVHEGVYREELVPQYDGAEGAPITFKAAKGEEVVISANEELGRWTLSDAEKNIYTTSMNWNLGATRNQLFIDGKMLSEARYPNGPEWMFEENKLSNAWPVKGDFWRPIGAENSSIVRSSSLLWQDEPDYWDGGYFIGYYSSQFAVMTANIVGSSYGELELGDEKTEYWYENSEGYVDYGYIVGHMNALDAPGEWIHEWDDATNKGTMHLIFPENATPGQTVVEAKTRQRVIDLNDRKFVNIEGFKTIGGGVRMNNSEMCMLNGLDMKYISHYIHQSNSYKGAIDFPYNATNKDGNPEKGESGIFITGQDNIITNCEIDHSAGAGIISAGLYAYIENNVIHDSYNSNYVSGIQIMTRGYENTNKARGGAAIYNNTIYNTGRSCINISVDNNATQLYSPFLPMDIAYNDLHDGSLTTADTGVVYGYHTTQGFDGYMSNFRNNYIYATKTDLRDKNSHCSAIYHDGNQRGLDTYDNQIFYTGTSGFSSGGVYYQLSQGSPAYSRDWNNGNHGEVRGELHEGYFKEDRPFYAGSLQNVDYTMNYDRFVNGESGIKYKAKDAEYLESVTIDEESGYAKFSENGDYIHFNDVEFPTDADVISLAVRGDASYSQDVLEVIVGDTLETGRVYTITARINTYDKTTPERIKCIIKPTSGTNDVWVRVKDYRSIELGGISAHKIASQIIPEEYAVFEHAGQFIEKGNVGGIYNTLMPEGPTPLYHTSINPDAPSLNNTYGQWYVKYNMDLNADADKFIITTRGGLPAQEFRIYVDGFDEEHHLVTFKRESTSFQDEFLPQIVPLDTIISQGAHDVYVYFPYTGQTSTIVSLGFAKVGADLSVFNTDKGKIYGGNFDADLSEENEDYPFRKALINPPDYSHKGLTYTLPGTVAAYKKVNIPTGSTKFVMSYSADSELCGQTVEVYIDAQKDAGGIKLGEFTTGGNGLLNFVTQELTFPSEVSSGEHDVYIYFGGNFEDKVQTCNLRWFKFE